MSSATPSAPIVTAGQNAFQLSQSGAEQSTLGGPSDVGGVGSLASNAPTGASAFAWILAFVVLGFLLWLVNKTRIGHVILYYLLVLATVSTLLMNYRWLSSALAPLSNLAGSGAGGMPGTTPPDSGKGSSK